MSAASFLGISAQIFADGYDGLIYSIGFLVGWPIILFLMAERLRNLGRYTFADVASFRFAQPPVRSFAALSTLSVVLFYLIAQMVGAGQLIRLLFGLPYSYAVVIVGVLMTLYVLFGGMIATTWVQIIKAVLLLGCATFMALAVLAQFGFSPEALFARAVEVKTDLAAATGLGAAEAAERGRSIMGPGNFIKRSDLGHLLRHGADVRHRRPAAHIDALLHRSERATGADLGAVGDRLDRLFLHPHLHHRLRRDRAGGDRSRLPRSRRRPARRRQHGGGASRRRDRRQSVPRLRLRGRVRDHPRGRRRPDPGRRLGGLARLYATVLRKGEVDQADELRVSRRTVLVLAAIAVLLGIVFEKTECRLHGRPRLRAGGVGQLPGADPVAAVEGLHDPRRRRRRHRRRACWRWS